MDKEFFCPVCGTKLIFDEHFMPYEKANRFICRCENCEIEIYGGNEITAYLNYLRAIPANFYLNQIIEKLDRLSQFELDINSILFHVRSLNKKKGGK